MASQKPICPWWVRGLGDPNPINEWTMCPYYCYIVSIFDIGIRAYSLLSRIPAEYLVEEVPLRARHCYTHFEARCYHSDNMATLTYAKDPKYHGWTKHINIRYHFIIDMILQKVMISRLNQYLKTYIRLMFKA